MFGFVFSEARNSAVLFDGVDGVAAAFTAVDACDMLAPVPIAFTALTLN
jgi:hypothetical protein